MNVISYAANFEFTRLVFAPGNPNAMSDAEYKLLVEALRQTGTLLQRVLVRPILKTNVRSAPISSPGDERLKDCLLEVIDGEHRARACRDAGVKLVACEVALGLTDAEARALRIGINKLRGSLDIGKVGAELADILGPLGVRQEAFDVLSLVGYAHDELQTILELSRHSGADDVVGLAAGGAPEEDRAPDRGGGGGAPGSRTLSLRFKTADEATAAREALARLDADPAKALQLLLTRQKRIRKDKHDE